MAGAACWWIAMYYSTVKLSVHGEVFEDMLRNQRFRSIM